MPATIIDDEIRALHLGPFDRCHYCGQRKTSAREFDPLCGEHRGFLRALYGLSFRVRYGDAKPRAAAERGALQ